MGQEDILEYCLPLHLLITVLDTAADDDDDNNLSGKESSLNAQEAVKSTIH